MAQHVSGDTSPIIRGSKTVIVASGFTYVFGCLLPLQWLSHRSGNRQPKTYVKPEAAITVFELLMMGGVSLETCWAIKKHWNNKFYYTFASCWFFLCDLYYDARIHDHQVHKHNLAQDTDKRRAVRNIVMKLLIPWNVGISWLAEKNCAFLNKFCSCYQLVS